MKNNVVGSKESKRPVDGELCSKFKDAEKLSSAYMALERDYTKKCQELAKYKKLERRLVEEKQIPSFAAILDKQVAEFDETDNKTGAIESSFKNTENLQNMQDNAEIEAENAENSKETAEIALVLEDEKQKQPAASLYVFDRPDWREKVLDFFAVNPDAKTYSKDIAVVLDSDSGVAGLDNALDVAYSIVKSKHLVNPESVVVDDDFIEKNIVGNKKLYDKIMASFLDGKIAEKKNAPVLSGTKTGTIVTPAKRIASLDDAKKILLEGLFKN